MCVWGGGGLINYSRGMQVHVCICGNLDIYKHIQCSDNRGACRYVYEVQGSIYRYETRVV